MNSTKPPKVVDGATPARPPGRPDRTDREARRLVEEKRDAAYFLARDAARLDGEKMTAQLRAMRLAKEAREREQKAAIAAAATTK